MTYTFAKMRDYRVGEYPAVPKQFEVAARRINWATAIFKCLQPEELDNEEFNLILINEGFNGREIMLTRSCDFEFADINFKME